MNGDRDSERQRLLAGVLAGDIAADAPEVLAACGQDPAFAAEMHDLEELQAVLRRRARTMQEDLREPAGALHGAAASALPAPQRRTAGARRATWWLVAAAVLAAVVWSLWPDAFVRRVAPEYLGGVEVRTSADGRGLEFVYTLSAGQQFRVRVLDEHGKEIVATPRFRTPAWRPDPELAANWSSEWTVHVEVIGTDVTPPQAGEVRHWSPATKND